MTDQLPDRVRIDDFNAIPLPEDLIYEENSNGDQPNEPFTGLTHAQVLALEFPQERMLIEDLVPIGAVGTIAGVPETYKSWQAQTIATAVATGEGGIFGRPVVTQGPVGYFWQDDSTREEAERVKLYDKVHGEGIDIPIRWHLNEGLRLPEHIGRLRATIEHHNYALCVLDSFYNVLFGIDLKDEEAEQVIALLKSEICDKTNCTVLIVDHMAWATQENRKRLRAYGGVFKGAAIRYGIYLDAVGTKIYAEGRGNNITGFKRQLAEWDEETLELKLIGTTHVDGTEYEQRILDHLAEHPDQTTDQMDAIEGTKSHLVAARGRLLDQNKLVRAKSRTSYRGFIWNLSNHASPTGSEVESNQLTDPNWFGSSTGSPLRGENQTELVTEPAPDDELPF